MSDSPDYEPEPTPAEEAIGERLLGDRPVPPGGFRGALERHLAALDPRYGPRPDDLRLRVSGYIGAGALLLTVALLQALGSL
ncbi:MAG: hypothetical protein ACYDHH_12045 [Solirubrobacteraceae bacterium]